MIKYVADPRLDMYGYFAQKNRAEAEKAVEKTEMNKRDFVPPSIMLSGEFKEIENDELFN